MSGEPTIGDRGGEFALIERALDSKDKRALPPQNDPILIGPGLGYDGALLRFPRDIAVTTDMLMEGRHFRFDWISGYDCGWRAVVASVSDCAAMGAWPKAGFLSVALPADFSASGADEIIRGVRDALERYGAALAGGDTIATDGPVVLNVCLLADSSGRMIGRGPALPGDAICITGAPGASRAAVQALLKGVSNQIPTDLVQAYARPHARLEAGVWLSGQTTCHALMDVSDGLASDLHHIARASAAGIVIDEPLLPHSPLAAAVQDLTGEEPAVSALFGGEDYELVFAVEADSAAGVLHDLSAHTGTRATAIGRVVAEQGVFVTNSEGQRRPLHGGYQHFPTGD